MRRWPHDQVSTQQLDAAAKPVWEHYKRDGAVDNQLRAEWLTAVRLSSLCARHACSPPVHRSIPTTARRVAAVGKLLNEFNLSGLGRHDLTPEVAAVFAARVLLHPGETQPTTAELQYVEHLFDEWWDPDTRSACLTDVERLYGKKEKLPRGRPKKRASLPVSRPRHGPRQ